MVGEDKNFMLARTNSSKLFYRGPAPFNVFIMNIRSALYLQCAIFENLIIVVKGS